jgi:hypothetical protein
MTTAAEILDLIDLPPSLDLAALDHAADDLAACDGILCGLGRAERAVLTLRLVGLAPAEIATHLGWSVTAVEAHMWRLVPALQVWFMEREEATGHHDEHWTRIETTFMTAVMPSGRWSSALHLCMWAPLGGDGAQ